MGNKNYRKGVLKERKILNKWKEEGKVGTRSAGSHGIWDLTLVDPMERKIKLVQCKPENYTGKDAETYSYLNGTYEVTFEVI